MMRSMSSDTPQQAKRYTYLIGEMYDFLPASCRYRVLDLILVRVTDVTVTPKRTKSKVSLENLVLYYSSIQCKGSTVPYLALE